MFLRRLLILTALLTSSVSFAGLTQTTQTFKGQDSSGKDVVLVIRTLADFQGARTEIELTVGSETLKLTDNATASLAAGFEATTAVIFEGGIVGYGARSASSYNAVYNESLTLDVKPDGNDGDNKVTVSTGRLSRSQPFWKADLEKVEN